jgi:subtilisin family serine protease
VLVELRHSVALEQVVLEHEPDFSSTLRGPLGESLGESFRFVLDRAFMPVRLSAVTRGGPRAVIDLTASGREVPAFPEASTYIVRGEIPDDAEAQRNALEAALARDDVVGVFSDPEIVPSPICGGHQPLGSAEDVAGALDTSALRDHGMTGADVHIAIVDTGINLPFLQRHGRPHQRIDRDASWTPPGVPSRPGAHPVDHGTMCAFDAGIVSPDATLLDHSVLLAKPKHTPDEPSMSGLLTDALQAFSQLQQFLAKMSADRRRLVVSNSWGMFDPAWDFPVGHPGNYSDNPQHPFNVIVRTLVAAGADVLFAAGNCGRDCPDPRCAYRGQAPITGANSHPSVISVAGVDIEKGRVGYSSQGPGRLDPKTPTLCGYTHFAGSGVYAADGGTSAACPVLAGYIAAIRARYPAVSMPPLQLRSLICKSAEDLGKPGFDYDYGWGVPSTNALLALLPT